MTLFKTWYDHACMQWYFGFGANRDSRMIRAITGRCAIGIPAQITGFQLCVESIKHIPEKARRILYTKWDANFVSYGIVPKETKTVRGRLWLLSNSQRELIRRWELVGTWSREVHVTAQCTLLGFHLSVPAVSEELLQQQVSLVEKATYKTFIVPRNRLLRVARMVRPLRLLPAYHQDIKT